MASVCVAPALPEARGMIGWKHRRCMRIRLLIVVLALGNAAQTFGAEDPRVKGLLETVWSRGVDSALAVYAALPPANRSPTLLIAVADQSALDRQERRGQQGARSRRGRHAAGRRGPLPAGPSGTTAGREHSGAGGLSRRARDRRSRHKPHRGDSKLAPAPAGESSRPAHPGERASVTDGCLLAAGRAAPAVQVRPLRPHFPALIEPSTGTVRVPSLRPPASNGETRTTMPSAR